MEPAAQDPALPIAVGSAIFPDAVPSDSATSKKRKSRSSKKRRAKDRETKIPDNTQTDIDLGMGNREPGNLTLAILLRECADVVESGLNDPILDESLLGLRAYCKNKCATTKKKPSKRHRRRDASSLTRPSSASTSSSDDSSSSSSNSSTTVSRRKKKHKKRKSSKRRHRRTDDDRKNSVDDFLCHVERPRHDGRPRHEDYFRPRFDDYPHHKQHSQTGFTLERHDHRPAGVSSRPPLETRNGDRSYYPRDDWIEETLFSRGHPPPPSTYYSTEEALFSRGHPPPPSTYYSTPLYSSGVPLPFFDAVTDTRMKPQGSSTRPVTMSPPRLPFTFDG